MAIDWKPEYVSEVILGKRPLPLTPAQPLNPMMVLQKMLGTQVPTQQLPQPQEQPIQ